MRQKGFAPILILLVVVGLGLFVYFSFFYKSPSPSPIQETISPVPTTTSSATPDPTANWKTYESILYSYSVEYPPDWKVAETKHNSASVIDSSKQKLMTELSNSTSSIKVFYEGDFDHGFEPWVFKTSSKVSVGGKEASMSTLTLGGNPNEWIIYTIENFHDFRIEAFVAPSDKNIVSQIISTFKFNQ